MNRFRPNIVIAGAEPFAEDRWQTIRINTQFFDLVKPCNRCVVTMVDQQTGERAGKEPLQTLASFRRLESRYSLAAMCFPVRWAGPSRLAILSRFSRELSRPLKGESREQC